MYKIIVYTRVPTRQNSYLIIDSHLINFRHQTCFLLHLFALFCTLSFFSFKKTPHLTKKKRKKKKTPLVALCSVLCVRCQHHSTPRQPWKREANIFFFFLTSTVLVQSRVCFRFLAKFGKKRLFNYTYSFIAKPMVSFSFFLHLSFTEMLYDQYNTCRRSAESKDFCVWRGRFFFFFFFFWFFLLFLGASAVWFLNFTTFSLSLSLSLSLFFYFFISFIIIIFIFVENNRGLINWLVWCKGSDNFSQKMMRKKISDQEDLQDKGWAQMVLYLFSRFLSLSLSHASFYL